MKNNSYRETLESTCVHFNGIQMGKCKAGVEYGCFPGAVPCIKLSRASSSICAQKQLPTAEQVDKEIAEHDAASKRFLTVLPLINRIRNQHKDQNWRGIEKCPICQGQLHIQISAYNGHTRGQCETKDCISWIE